ncbi:hypothetical protein D9M71_602620 [compost metagenome]
MHAVVNGYASVGGVTDLHVVKQDFLEESGHVVAVEQHGLVCAVTTSDASDGYILACPTRATDYGQPLCWRADDMRPLQQEIIGVDDNAAAVVDTEGCTVLIGTVRVEAQAGYALVDRL